MCLPLSRSATRHWTPGASSHDCEFVACCLGSLPTLNSLLCKPILARWLCNMLRCRPKRRKSQASSCFLTKRSSCGERRVCISPPERGVEALPAAGSSAQEQGMGNGRPALDLVRWTKPLLARLPDCCCWAAEVGQPGWKLIKMAPWQH